MSDDVHIEIQTAVATALPLSSAEIAAIARRVLWNPAQVTAADLRTLAAAVLAAAPPLSEDADGAISPRR